MKAGWQQAAVAAGLVVACTTTTALAAKKKNNEIAQALEQTYSLTKSPDRLSIKSAGDLYIIQADGISGDPSVRRGDYPQFIIEDGKITPQGGYTGFMRDNTYLRPFQPGEKVYVTQVANDGDEIGLWLLSADTYQVNVDGNTQSTRYKTLLDFVFPDGFVASNDFATIKEALDAVLINEKDYVPPEPKTIELGQSPEEVEQAFGKPQKITKLGPKTIYFYEDMKVIFIDGKVSDIE